MTCDRARTRVACIGVSGDYIEDGPREGLVNGTVDDRVLEVGKRHIVVILALLHVFLRDVVGGVFVWPDPIIEIETGALEVAES